MANMKQYRTPDSISMTLYQYQSANKRAELKFDDL